MLAAGRAELHQSLSSLGVSLLRLDIGSFGHAQARGGEGSEAREGQAQGPASRDAAGDGADAQDAQENVLVPLGAALSSGGLVDVLA